MLESDHLAAIVRSSDDAIISKDRAAVITSWNDGAQRLYGYSPEEAVGQPIAMLIPGNRAGEERELLDRVLRGERVEHYETERVRKDGTTIWISLTVSPIHDARGTVVGASAQARQVRGPRVDETEIERTRHALADAEQRFRGAFHEAPIGMAVVSIEPGNFGRVEQVNEALCELLGYTAQELSELGVLQATYTPDRERERPLLEQLFAGERESYGIEKRLVHRSGRLIWVWVTVSLLRLESGEPRFALGHVQDISERKATEEALREAQADLERSNAELDQFAYVASHDLKEPLILVAAYARMLEQRHASALDDDGRHFLAGMRDETARMKAMIDDLLAFSRLETDAGDSVSVDLADAVSAAIRTLGPQLEECGGHVEVQPGLPTVEGSASHFERLFRNLIANALKFRADESPRVEVVAEREGEDWTIAVCDNGIGIDPARAERIFEVFQRLHGQERYPGTGMGLAICRRIVERHGGQIWVEPRPGGGSVFRFTLPAGR